MAIWEHITKPTLLLDQVKTIKNIEMMVQKAQRSRVRLRPHFKTHQSAIVGEWFRARGVETITVSSIAMADYFAQAGWRDILIAFPINLREIASINALASQVRLHVLLESSVVATKLNRLLQTDVYVWLKVDVGYQRTGIDYEDTATLTNVTQVIRQAKHLHLMGILTHAGHTYHASSKTAVQTIYQEAVERMQQAKKVIGGDLAVSIGDTPGCSIVDTFGEVDEIRPGNFVFYDLMQYEIGACPLEAISIALACPVVAKHPSRDEIVIYGGAVHLSKEALSIADGHFSFGRVALLTEQGWSSLVPETNVKSLSQEHGIIQTNHPFLDTVQIGDLLAILPVHACLTANLMGRYVTLDGETIPMMRL